jgi:hypothetical protein
MDRRLVADLQSDGRDPRQTLQAIEPRAPVCNQIDQRKRRRSSAEWLVASSTFTALNSHHTVSPP